MCACSLGYRAVAGPGCTALFIAAEQPAGRAGRAGRRLRALRRKLRQYARAGRSYADEGGLPGKYASAPARRPAVQSWSAGATSTEDCGGDDRPPRLRREGGAECSPCSLRGLVDRPAHAPRRGGAHRRCVIAARGGRRAPKRGAWPSRLWGTSLAPARRFDECAAVLSAPPIDSGGAHSAALLDDGLAVFGVPAGAASALWSYGPEVRQAWREQLVPDEPPPEVRSRRAIPEQPKPPDCRHRQTNGPSRNHHANHLDPLNTKPPPQLIRQGRHPPMRGRPEHTRQISANALTFKAIAEVDRKEAQPLGAVLPDAGGARNEEGHLSAHRRLPIRSRSPRPTCWPSWTAPPSVVPRWWR